MGPGLRVRPRPGPAGLRLEILRHWWRLGRAREDPGLRIDLRPRYEPRNLTFAAGLHHWTLGGSFTENALQSHWQDYHAAADHGTAVLSSAVPQPEGFAWLAQEIFADDYRGTTVTFRGTFRTPDTTARAGLFLRVMTPHDAHGPFTAEAALADPANHIVTIDNHADWTTHEIPAPIPHDTNTIAFGVFLAGSGRIELRDPGLSGRPSAAAGHLRPAENSP